MLLKESSIDGIRPYRPKKVQSKEEPKTEGSNDLDEEEFEDIPV